MLYCLSFRNGIFTIIKFTFMKIILLQDVANVGKKFEVVSVADGYALNYLIPRGVAERSTAAKEKMIENKKVKEEEKRTARIEEVAKSIKSLKNKPIKIQVKANDKGVLFAGLEKTDLLSALKDQTGVELDKDEIRLDENVKSIGEYDVPVTICEGTSLVFLIEGSK